MDSSQISNEIKQEKYYKICLAIGTFVYFLWKFLVHAKSPGFEPWFFRTPSLLIGIAFFTSSFLNSNLNKYAKHVFFANSVVVLFEFFYLIYLYSDSFLGLFYFMGGFVVVIPHIIAWRNKKYLTLYGVILTISSITLFLSIYAKTKIFQNQTFDYLFLYSTAFIIVWFLTYIHLINEDQFKALEKSVREKELAIIKSSRLASLGEVAGGLAHEINNPLQILNLSLDVVREDQSNKSGVVDKMDHALSRISAIIEGLKFFSGRSDQGIMSEIYVKDALNKALSVINEKAVSNEISIDVENDESKLYCQEIQLSQVFLSILNNACDNIIKTSPEKKEIRVIIKQDLNNIQILIQDSGDYISDSISSKIFDPFFTTKPIGQGSGLGLSISKGIVEQLGGTIQYLENPKRFEISFKRRQGSLYGQSKTS